MLGPQISKSKTPTLYPLLARSNESCVDSVLFPTPPFPDRTRSLFLICEMGEYSDCGLVLGAFAEAAQAEALGHPAQPSAVPASGVPAAQTGLAPSGGVVDVDVAGIEDVGADVGADVGGGGACGFDGEGIVGGG